MNVVERYPQKGMLTSALDTSYAVGGCVPNTLIDLAKIDRDLFLTALGRVGADEYGRYAIEQMNQYGIDTTRIIASKKGKTGTTQVMTEQASGERTFFSAMGENSQFGEEDIDIGSLHCEIFHIGYLMLLDALDQKDSTYGTKLARVLKKVQDKGIKTSIDVVSEEGERFAAIIVPALHYCNYVIMNEIECCKVTGLAPRKVDGRIDMEHIRATMETFLSYGVRDKVIIHFQEGCACLDVSGRFTVVPSLSLPKGYIKGSVGAGDAFAAASLYGLYNGWDDQRILEFATAAAACNLAAEDSVSGMKTAAEIITIEKTYERRAEV